MRRLLVRTAAATGLLVVVVCLVAVLQPARPLEYRSEVLIGLPLQDSWCLLQDLSLAHLYVPGVVATQITSTEKLGTGASRRVYSSKSEYINETVTAWHPGRGFTLRLHDEQGHAPRPFSDAQFSYELLQVSEASTLLKVQLEIILRAGRAGEWLAHRLFSDALQARVDGVAAAIKHFYEQDRGELTL